MILFGFGSDSKASELKLLNLPGPQVFEVLSNGYIKQMPDYGKEKDGTPVIFVNPDGRIMKKFTNSNITKFIGEGEAWDRMCYDHYTFEINNVGDRFHITIGPSPIGECFSLLCDCDELKTHPLFHFIELFKSKHVQKASNIKRKFILRDAVDRNLLQTAKILTGIPAFDVCAQWRKYAILFHKPRLESLSCLKDYVDCYITAWDQEEPNSQASILRVYLISLYEMNVFDTSDKTLLRDIFNEIQRFTDHAISQLPQTTFSDEEVVKFNNDSKIFLDWFVRECMVLYAMNAGETVYQMFENCFVINQLFVHMEDSNHLVCSAGQEHDQQKSYFVLTTPSESIQMFMHKLLIKLINPEIPLRVQASQEDVVVEFELPNTEIKNLVDSMWAPNYGTGAMEQTNVIRVIVRPNSGMGRIVSLFPVNVSNNLTSTRQNIRLIGAKNFEKVPFPMGDGDSYMSYIREQDRMRILTCYPLLGYINANSCWAKMKTDWDAGAASIYCAAIKETSFNMLDARIPAVQTRPLAILKTMLPQAVKAEEFFK